MNGSVKHVFHNKYARQAALKAATKGYTNIRIYTSGSAVPGSAAIERDKMIELVLTIIAVVAAVAMITGVGAIAFTEYYR